MSNHPDIDNRFDYHPPSDGARIAHENVRWATKDFALYLTDNLPDGREKALALTKIEEVLFWANAAIARNQSQQ